MESADRLPVARPLTTGWGATIYFEGNLYPGRVLECKKPIEPGQSGEAVVAMMASQAETLGLQEGSIIELRDGPKAVIATATVLSYRID
jgi:hypothetical protein